MTGTKGGGSENGRRPVRIANCSGALMDPAIHMLNQAKHGPVDVITGDYLAEQNMAVEAEGMAAANRPGWIASAYEALKLSLDTISEKGIKVVINGGGMNPKGLAEEVLKMIQEKKLKLRVAFVDGDNLTHKVHRLLKPDGAQPVAHLDHINESINLSKDALFFLDQPDTMPIVTANAYLGYRAIKKGLDSGADIIICGRVADASPVIGAAAWWHGWEETAYDELAAALVGGHLIECSTYITGGNFAGAYKRPVEDFLSIGCPIAEIAGDGVCVITKHESLGGFVTPDTVKCQLLYELQGNIYLNSDVKASLDSVQITEQAPNRVKVTGIKGHPPPPTTKLAIFYRGGYQCELLLNACGYAVDHKWDIQEAQIRNKLQEWGALEKLDVLEFQRVGTSAVVNPTSQLASTMYMRVFAQARDAATVMSVPLAWNHYFMAHYPGMHCSLDLRTLVPKSFLGYYPAVVSQTEVEEAVTMLEPGQSVSLKRVMVGPPKVTEPMQKRENYETKDPAPLSSFGPTEPRPIGDVVLARSGDKGGNVNIGLFVQTAKEWDWFRSFMTKDRLQTMMGRDWQDWYFIERVEFPGIYSVHFVVYGPLGRGVSSSALLDNLGKGFAEFIRAVHVPVPVSFLEDTSKL